MTATANMTESRPCWFVGAAYGSDDQAPKFISEGVWVNGYKDRYLDLIRSIQVGDRIAIKAAYTRKRDLPFDNRDQTVSVMSIKALGLVTANAGDGRHLSVKWQEVNLDTPREWYFYTGRATVWRVMPGEWRADALIAFAFDGVKQDLAKFQNAPFWRERFGTKPSVEHRFGWTRFYEAIADKLLAFRHERQPLVAAIHEIAGRVDALSHLQDHFADGTTGPLRDICPFTTLGIFNRGITESNRKIIATELAAFLGVHEPIPESFEGIPVLNNQKSWFFRNETVRRASDIDTLWDVFAAALELAGSDAPDAREEFIRSFDAATECNGVAWNLTFGMYWARPWAFVPLDANSRQYVTKTLGLGIGGTGHKGLPSATEYLTLVDSLEVRFAEEAFPIHSFPELSVAALQTPSVEVVDQPPDQEREKDDDSETEGLKPVAVLPPFTVQTIIDDGCFLSLPELNRLLERLRSKKNLILQGPPGTGKTWLAKRLAFALMGQRDEKCLRVLQFHPNMSYEDFVRGWRPTGEGKLALVDGPLMELVKAARQTPGTKHVLVIEEINRGNPAQIFGETLTLMEADKRTPSEAIELCHRREAGERVYIPDNIYLIGTMNIADRSLALVDFALRRRFAFVDLEPRLGKPWRDWVTSRCGVDAALLTEVESRILALNEEIAADVSLGKAFRIGHSYVTPPVGIDITNSREWFIQVFETEVGPLLHEYWFDSAEKARDAQNRLTEGL